MDYTNIKILKKHLGDDKDNFCYWEAQGNGHYLTECGKLFRDKGRFVEMLNEVYDEGISPVPKIYTCKQCGRKTITYKEIIN